MSMSALAADTLVVVHLAFVLFVVLGGLLVYRWPRWAWLHVPAFAWGALIEFNNWVCPLTPLEQRLRLAAGEGGYGGGFSEHYLLPLIYPEGLTREIQLALGLFVLAINALVYGIWLWRKWRKRAG
ncbi:DUF2784 domain-containing protein [Pseudomonadota bacterium]|jgi:hypothetical protein